MLYHYFKKIDGNVCMDWRLTSDLSTSLQTGDGKTKRVNAKAFEQFLNPDFKGADAGSCQGAGPSLDDRVCFAMNAGKETAGTARLLCYVVAAIASRQLQLFLPCACGTLSGTVPDHVCKKNESWGEILTSHDVSACWLVCRVR